MEYALDHISDVKSSLFGIIVRLRESSFWQLVSAYKGPIFQDDREGGLLGVRERANVFEGIHARARERTTGDEHREFDDSTSSSVKNSEAIERRG